MSETDPNRQPGEPMPDEGSGPIPIEPSAPEPVRQPVARKAKIESPGLMDDFDEDTDFESDPDVERIVKGVPVEPRNRPVARVSAEEEPKGDPISAPGSWRVPGAIGAAVTITAAVFAGVYAPSVIWAHVLITVYWAALHTATGVGAVVVSALLLGRPIGQLESAAARMLLAVSLFLVVYSLDIPITTSKFEETVLGAAAYFGAVVVAFRLHPRDAAVVGGAHFGLALLVGLGSLLSSLISSGAAA